MSDQTKLIAEGRRLGVYQVHALLGAGGMAITGRGFEVRVPSFTEIGEGES